MKVEQDDAVPSDAIVVVLEVKHGMKIEQDDEVPSDAIVTIGGLRLFACARRLLFEE